MTLHATARLYTQAEVAETRRTAMTIASEELFFSARPDVAFWFRE